ncbi:fatty acid desaturase [Antarcticimicrobium sediminis]|uniref:Fatty acid desaturase n=1 Tax=Antarcticimicrobium sediminis TaxID=2546227 RepID=A0A4R5F177_9RHOB|nr:fatty acid desaturase [Antarcticimicrobium sediminis]TDE41032.1 fatty acid desaturase [Antarcticimicrobium sediminis]
MSESRSNRPTAPEWRTLALILGCYASALGLLFAPLPSGLVAVLLVPVLVLHSSLSHEALHDHPFRARVVNEVLMALPLTLVIPYGRFRDLHLAHHLDARLTDPYDDPESNYLDPVIWAGLSRWSRGLYALNNTLLGRILLGPAIGQARFMAGDWAQRRVRAVWQAWALHLPGALAVLWVVTVAPLPLWTYLLACYGALGVLKIRTFLEHRAHAQSRARTVIVEDRGLLSFLFLNNNLHVVHHMHPTAPWYRLPQLYRVGRARYLNCNEHYVYRSYGAVIRRFLLCRKDPVAHPLWRRG